MRLAEKAREVWLSGGFGSINSYILDAIERANRFWEEQAGPGPAKERTDET